MLWELIYGDGEDHSGFEDWLCRCFSLAEAELEQRSPPKAEIPGPSPGRES